MSPLQMRRSSPLETLDVIMPQAGCCVAVGLEYRCTYISIYRCGDTSTPGLECVLDCLYCMLQQHCAIGLQTDCMMAVPAPVARLPDSHVYALWP